MGKIVRLTESDLVRIVKRVINEAAAGPFTVGGKKYNLTVFTGSGQVGYDSGDGVAVTDPKIVAALNTQSGYEIPTASGIVNKAYVATHKTKMPKLASFLGV
jgi:hypothetical protein